MGYPRNEDFILKYDYDFSTQGGAVSSITLSSDVNSLGEGVIVKRLRVIMKTAFTSGGTPTVTIGNTGDTDGYMADIYALGAASADAVINSSAVAGALIWDDTNDHEIYYRIDSTANNQDLVITIGTAALTAGKFELYLECAYDPD